MKNWNAFSIFKYLTGSLELHITFVLILYQQGSIVKGKLGDLPDFYDQKDTVVTRMFYCHLICLILQIVDFCISYFEIDTMVNEAFS